MADTLKIRLDSRKALATIKAHLESKGGKATLVAGVLNGATRRPDANVNERVPIAPYAAVQEFGSKHVPARAPFRRTFFKQKDNWARGVYEIASRRPNWTAESILKGMLHRVPADIQDTIENDEFKPLAPATIRFKKRMGYAQPEKPMIATGSFVQSISAEVRKK